MHDQRLYILYSTPHHMSDDHASLVRKYGEAQAAFSRLDIFYERMKKGGFDKSYSAEFAARIAAVSDRLTACNAMMADFEGTA